MKQRPDLNIVQVRGNVETRIRKIKDENMHGIVLAASGIIRANLQDKISSYLPVDVVIPAPAQGALAIEIRSNDSTIEGIVNSLKDENTEIQILAERGF